jgi:hypothetical protein
VGDAPQPRLQATWVAVASPVQAGPADRLLNGFVEYSGEADLPGRERRRAASGTAR